MAKILGAPREAPKDCELNSVRFCGIAVPAVHDRQNAYSTDYSIYIPKDLSQDGEGYLPRATLKRGNVPVRVTNVSKTP
jgi:hypothetical protein